MELAEELAPAGAVFGHRLEHHFGPGPSVLRQQYFGEPSFTQRLKNIVLFGHVHLQCFQTLLNFVALELLLLCRFQLELASEISVDFIGSFHYFFLNFFC